MKFIIQSTPEREQMTSKQRDSVKLKDSARSAQPEPSVHHERRHSKD